MYKLWSPTVVVRRGAGERQLPLSTGSVARPSRPSEVGKGRNERGGTAGGSPGSGAWPSTARGYKDMQRWAEMGGDGRRWGRTRE